MCKPLKGNQDFFPLANLVYFIVIIRKTCCIMEKDALEKDALEKYWNCMAHGVDKSKSDVFS
jgi:hypothetical protein